MYFYASAAGVQRRHSSSSNLLKKVKANIVDLYTMVIIWISQHSRIVQLVFVCYLEVVKTLFQLNVTVAVKTSHFQFRTKIHFGDIQIIENMFSYLSYLIYSYKIWH